MYKVYGTSTCGYCKRATALLQVKGHRYNYWPLDEEPELMKALQEKYGWKSVPIITFIDVLQNEDEIFIGGFTDLIKHFNGEP